MPDIPLPRDERHRKFADLVLNGTPAAAAYMDAGFKTTNPDVCATNASRLLKNAQVSAYMTAMRSKAAEKASISREEIIADLIAIIKSKPSEAGMDNPLCELRMSKAGPFATFPDKSKMLERLCKMLGYDAAQEHKHELTGLLSILSGLNGGAPNPIPSDRL